MIGAILDNKYRIDRQLGAGGMGNVYLAAHLGTTRVVALKVIAPRWAADPHFLARFQREAQACGRLRHPNIVNVTDFGIAAAGQSQVPYLVMELLDGQTLSSFQAANPRPALTVAADLLDQVALALAEAHRHGIVHRDLKPDNIWLEPDGRGGFAVKVLDFGVAKMKLPGEPLPAPAASAALSSDAAETVLMGEAETVAMAVDPSSGAYGSDGGQTMPGSLVGTPAYMSPEQALGKEIDFRSDIYSLAVVAYSLVCGELPFSGKTSELVAFHQSGSPRPPAVQKVPPDVSEAVLAGLARNPADRPPSAIEFARRFHNAVDAEFFALRRSKAFLLQHFATVALVIAPLYGVVLAAIALLGALAKKLLPAATPRLAATSLAAALLLVFADNLLRAVAALIALDEQVRVRRFISLRVMWRLPKALPALAFTQACSLFAFGSGWIVRDCLWPVVCLVEKRAGKAAVLRSRSLMNGLNSAGRALAIRHLALPALVVAQLVRPLGSRPNPVVTATWFPLFAVFAAAALFLYDRTSAPETGPLLRLDRTPEVRVTARRLSASSMAWLALVAVYFFYKPLWVWLFGAK